jgi:hypothetical protein
MATRPQIGRLARRIESLAAVCNPMRYTVIWVGSDESVEVAKERHYSSHPEDRGLQEVVVQYVAAKDGRPRQGPQSGEE